MVKERWPLRGKPLEQYDAGRICAKKGCKKVLSRYNRGGEKGLCYEHTPRKFKLPRGPDS